MKDTMIVYTAYAEKFKKLTDEQFGKLIRCMMEYQQTGIVPDIDDMAVSLAFDVVKYDIDRNLEKYERVVQRNQENGKKGGRPKNEMLVTERGTVVPDGQVDGHFLYLIRDNVSGELKIGETVNLAQRRYTIKRPTERLSIVDFAIGSMEWCRNTEREILEKYKQYSNGGEWFQGDDVLEQELLNEYFLSKPKRFPKNPVGYKKPDNDNVNDNEYDNENGNDNVIVLTDNSRKKKSSNELSEEVVKAWNAIPNRNTVPMINGIARDSTRWKLLKARESTYGREGILKAIEEIGQSSFLRGWNPKGWYITFDWFVKPNNFPKVFDGNYRDKTEEVPRAFTAIDGMGLNDGEVTPVWEVLQ